MNDQLTTTVYGAPLWALQVTYMTGFAIHMMLLHQPFSPWRGAWALFWPIVTPVMLPYLALRAIWRRLGRGAAPKSGETDTRAPARESVPSSAAPLPYGSRPDESQRPVTQEQHTKMGVRLSLMSCEIARVEHVLGERLDALEAKEALGRAIDWNDLTPEQKSRLWSSDKNLEVFQVAAPKPKTLVVWGRRGSAAMVVIIADGMCWYRSDPDAKWIKCHFNNPDYTDITGTPEGRAAIESWRNR
jgi:hypothetical protein